MDRTPVKNRLMPRFRLVWSRNSAPKASWVAGLLGFQIRGGSRDQVIHLAMRGVMLWSAGLALLTFLVGTAIGSYLLSRNPYNRISYLDLVLPTRWSELKEKRGLTLIDQGLSELKARRYGPGIMLVNHGLRLAPVNIPARMIMGQMFVQSGMMQRAIKFFRDGIPYADGQRRYLDITFRLAEYMEDYALLLAMIDEAGPTVSPNDDATRRWLRDRRAHTLVKLGRYKEVMALCDHAQGEPSMALNTARVRALSGLGQGREAIRAVEANPAEFGIVAEPWRLLMELALQEKDTVTGLWAARKMVEADRTDMDLAVERIVFLTKIDATQEATGAVEEYFFRFGAKPTAQALLLKRLESTANPAVLHAIWRQVQGLGKPELSVRIAYVQDLIMAGELSEALREYDLARRVIEAGGTNETGWAEGNRLLIDVILTDSPSARSQLLIFCDNHPLNPDAYRLLVQSLFRNGRALAARDIVQLARNRYPAIHSLPEIEITEEDLNPKLMATAVPEKNEVRVTNPEAREALAALELDIKRGQWSQAVERIAKVERSPMAKELAEPLLYDRILIHGQLSNQTELSWYMRRILELKNFDAARLRGLAIRLRDAGKTDSAVTLLREVMRKYPEASWASALRQEIQEDLKAAPLDIAEPIK